MKISYQDALAYYGIDGAHPGGMSLTKAILENEKINNEKIILDAGCGTGETSSYLAKTFRCKVYSIDNHEEMVKKASEKFLNERISANAVKGSIENIPFSDNSFDYIIAESSTVFGNISKVLSEYFRVLKHGGVLLNIDMTAEQKLSRNEKEELMKFYQIQDILTEKEWLMSIQKSGFKRCQIVKSASIFEALEQYDFDDNEIIAGNIKFENVNPEVDKVIETHQRLLVTYGEKLGYRVFRAVKI
ncbi:class I SAM-dependent methyltransferase [Neobacillus sp. NPDC097160]|uniref:class I SAM-dependent methyltransferase n=1 Tax=Neobacillus sp. NPDC097160 TaxID=3364298 RepID=UPI0038213FDC